MANFCFYPGKLLEGESPWLNLIAIIWWIVETDKLIEIEIPSVSFG
jgi:hypothetical protein